jgi:hypothetical protein
MVIYHILVNLNCLFVHYVLHTDVLSYRPCPIKDEIMDFLKWMNRGIQQA